MDSNHNSPQHETLLEAGQTLRGDVLRSCSLLYQLGWATLPGLRGLSCSEFRAFATDAPHSINGIAAEFATEAGREEFLKQLEAEFAARRFTNAADAFDTVKAYVLEHARNK